MQTTLHLMTTEQIARCWAFAIDKSQAQIKVRSKRLRDKRDCVITACSKEARALGIKAGMRYEEAKLLIPELRVMVCNWK